MKLTYSSKLFSRISGKTAAVHNRVYDTAIPRRPAFWRPARWIRTRSSDNVTTKSPKLPFLYRFQRRNLVEYSSRRYFSLSLKKLSVSSVNSSSLGKWTKKSLKWTPIPLVVAMFVLLYQQFVFVKRRKEDEEQDNLGSSFTVHSKRYLPWQVPNVFYVYQFLPLRALSRTWGWMNDLYLPRFLRRPILSSYVWLFGCDLSEAAIEDLKWYKNLGEFFRRHLKPGVRPVHAQSSVVSPSDGVVVHVGRVEDDCVERVKGLSYSLAAFLGPKTWFIPTLDEEPIVDENTAPEPSKDYRRSLNLRSKGTDLYHCVIYLAPGDYHRFHSPADWNIHFRRHFPGHLFSVSPAITRRIEGLFNYNERVVYYGTWKHGFFSMAAVGATNVGSIRVYFDERLKTNNRRYQRGAYQDWSFTQHKAPSGEDPAVALGKGDEFGEFNLGSTIVLLFEAPEGFQFNVGVGDRVQYGRQLGEILPHQSM